MILYFEDKELNIIVDDNSYRYRAIKGEHSLTLYFSLPQHVEIPVGTWCMFEAERYELEMPSNFKKKNTRNFEYTLIMESVVAKAKKYKFRNPVDRRLKFMLTAKPREHLQMFIDNMNARDSGWTIGECIEAPEKLISYNHAFCLDALTQQADEFETEYEFVGKKVSLHKVEYNKDNPLPLSYGKGNGFKPGVGRANYDDTKPIEVLYVQGGEKNIDASKYGCKELLLPKKATLRYDGTHFEGEAGFDASKARIYQTDGDGFSLCRGDKLIVTGAENSLDCSHIYPKRVGEISKVEVVNAEKNFYDFIDNSIPADLNYNDCLIAGETMTVIFQSGMLAGKEFEVKYYHEAKSVNGVIKAARRFEIVPQEIDGVTMPNNTFKPVAGQDTYAVFNISLPAAYVCNNAAKSGASWDMFRESVKYLYENEGQKFTFTGELDGAWAKRDWLNIGGRIRLGGYILFSDTQFQQEEVAIRIVGIKDYINNPHSPEIELSNQVIGSSFTSTLGKIEENEVIIEDNHKEALQFAKRRFRDTQEAMGMIQDSLLHFSGAINPITVQTMALLVGDESLQFQFVNNKTNPQKVFHSEFYNKETKVFSCESGIIQHMTLGIDSLASYHSADEYKFWDMAAFNSPVLAEPSKKYYLYAKVEQNGTMGTFRLSEAAIAIDSETGYYHLWLGIINSEYDGDRSYTPMYGFTEITPGRMVIDRIVAPDASGYWDFTNKAFKLGNALSFNTQGDNKLRLKGTLLQSESGDESVAGVFRGDYDNTIMYYVGDEVIYSGSTYRCIQSCPTAGIMPINTMYWKVIAKKGNNGQPGTDGISGEPGKDGVTYYTWIAYSDNANGSGMYQVPTDNTKYIGIAVNKDTPIESSNPSDYIWSRFKGEDGQNGTDGKPGPVVVYKGQWKATEQYYGNDDVVDVVYNNGKLNCYRARQGIGAIPVGSVVTDTQYWIQMNYFENIATGLLLAELAYINNLGVRYLTTSESGKRVAINGDNNNLLFFNENGECVIQIDTQDRLIDGNKSNWPVITINKELPGKVQVKNYIDSFGFHSYEYSSGSVIIPKTFVKLYHDKNDSAGYLIVRDLPILKGNKKPLYYNEATGQIGIGD